MVIIIVIRINGIIIIFIHIIIILINIIIREPDKCDSKTPENIKVSKELWYFYDGDLYKSILL